PISTDAAGSLEVNIRLQKAFAALSAGCSSTTRQAARRYADLSLERALQTLSFSQDRDKLRTIATVGHKRAQQAVAPQAAAEPN
ncbi:hypothetical protein N4Q66_26385, partial [Leclercia adecarboxylata]|uniref:hypothetical protein n=1 Tax=Leclercia adecarboxylata TaxID=83655 RepID=UPI00234D64BA